MFEEFKRGVGVVIKVCSNSFKLKVLDLQNQVQYICILILNYSFRNTHLYKVSLILGARMYMYQIKNLGLDIISFNFLRLENYCFYKTKKP